MFVRYKAGAGATTDNQHDDDGDDDNVFHDLQRHNFNKKVV